MLKNLSLAAAVLALPACEATVETSSTTVYRKQEEPPAAVPAVSDLSVGDVFRTVLLAERADQGATEADDKNIAGARERAASHKGKVIRFKGPATTIWGNGHGCIYVGVPTPGEEPPKKPFSYRRTVAFEFCVLDDQLKAKLNKLEKGTIVSMTGNVYMDRFAEDHLIFTDATLESP